MSAVPLSAPTRSRRRYIVLGAGVAAQAASSTFQFGMPFLLPQLRALAHGSLAEAGVLAACPNIGLVLTLVLWGWAADLWGERRAIILGLIGAAGLLALAASSGGPLLLGGLLILAGAAAASVNAASGRVVMAWFEPAERGLAMGIRQTAQPVGVAVAAVVLPRAAASYGLHGALLLPAATCLLVGLGAGIVIADPPWSSADSSGTAVSPYRSAPIWRVHAASALLIVPQFTVSSFAFLYLVTDQHTSSGTAGLVLGLTQLAGAGARLAAGRWSDVVGDRLGPMRALALANAVAIASLASVAASGSRASVVVLVIAVVVTVSGNGLAFTAVAEIAGSSWSGRALGVQNTLQNLVASGTPALMGVVITSTSFAGGFGAAIAFPFFAAIVIGRRRRL